MTRTTRFLLTTGALALGASIVAGASFASGRGERDGHRGGFGPGGGVAMLEQFDVNADGKVTQIEIDQVRTERFAAFDQNADGTLDLDEYQALWLDAMRPRMVDRFQQLDGDGSAGVTALEFAQPMSRMVSHLDDDDDGEISADELRQRGRHHGRRHHPGRDDD